jgi:hypothetical protein
MRFCSDDPVKLPTTAWVTDVGLCACTQKQVSGNQERGSSGALRRRSEAVFGGAP